MILMFMRYVTLVIMFFVYFSSPLFLFVYFFRINVVKHISRLT
jgi:hypothetical protein